MNPWLAKWSVGEVCELARVPLVVLTLTGPKGPCYSNLYNAECYRGVLLVLINTRGSFTQVAFLG